MDEITCAILAGGRSSRMGVDKALVTLDGQTLLDRAIALAHSVTDQILVVGREPPAGNTHGSSVRFVPDKNEPFSGPIAGIITALENASGPVLVIPCDMPLLTPDILQQLSAAHTRMGAFATMAVTKDAAGSITAEPLLALYTLQIIPILQQRLSAGRRSLQPLLEYPGVNQWEVPPDAYTQLTNVNDEQTLRNVRQRLAASSGD